MERLKALWTEMTPERRAKFYNLVRMVALLLAARGVVEADSIMGWIEVLGYALGVAAPTLARQNISNPE